MVKNRMQYWIMKSEPDTYSIDDLKSFNIDHWDGIRNYQVRNFFRDTMQVGDQAFFYHSNCKEPGIVGLMEIASEAYPDHTAFIKGEKYFDAKSDPDQPRWLMIDVKYQRHLKRKITLGDLRNQKTLESMRLLQRGNRLSVIPLEKKEWNYILGME
jgi:predicted RNA-binding protein with PUA-like domain|tara:strand:- start:3431 stop:3898 length:468 start_codon:yes stop_codon:yes gene_type:complete